MTHIKKAGHFSSLCLETLNISIKYLYGEAVLPLIKHWRITNVNSGPLIRIQTEEKLWIPLMWHSISTRVYVNFPEEFVQLKCSLPVEKLKVSLTGLAGPEGIRTF